MSRRFLAVGLLSLVACSSPKRTAEKDLQAAERALTGLPTTARDVVPDQVAAIEEAFKVGQQAVATGDYPAASTSLSAIPDQVKLITDSLPARQAAMRAEMDTLEIVVPRNLEAIRTELEHISRTRKLPAGMDRKGLVEVRQIQDSATAIWGEVKSQFAAGKLADALGKAQDLKARVSRALLALGLVADERAWSNVTLPPPER